MNRIERRKSRRHFTTQKELFDYETKVIRRIILVSLIGFWSFVVYWIIN